MRGKRGIHMERSFRNGHAACRALAAVLACVFCLTAVEPADAWFSNKSRQHAEERPLTKRQAKSLARRLVQGLFRQTALEKDELAKRVELSLISLDVRHKEMTDREFTDMILNSAWDSAEIIIVNQEPSLSVEDMGQRLISYDDEWTSRKRGIMLGADYVITGSVREKASTDEKGRAYVTYDGQLILKDIRKGSVVAEYREEQNKRKLKRKR